MSLLRHISLLSILLSLFILTSCNSINTVIKAKKEGKGTTIVYDIGKEDAWQIAKRSFRWGGSDAIEEYEAEGYMLTSSGQNFWSSGTVMGAWIEPISDTQSEVTVITKRRIATDIATTLTEGKWHKYFDAGVEIIKSGKTLPIDPPELE